MRFERKFYGFREGNGPFKDEDYNDVINDLNDMFKNSGADWFEEEARFKVADLTVIVFKLTYDTDPQEKPGEVDWFRPLGSGVLTDIDPGQIFNVRKTDDGHSW